VNNSAIPVNPMRRKGEEKIYIVKGTGTNEWIE
jgi:hypothetical protein